MEAQNKRRLDAWKNCVQPEVDLLVSCRNRAGEVNALAVAYACNCSFDPPMVMVGVVPSRYSHAMIEETGEFVVNIPTEAQRELYTYLGTTSRADEDKLKACGLRWEPGDEVAAPVLLDCPVNIECRVVDRLRTGSHDMFVGEVVCMHADEELVDEGGCLRHKALHPLDFR